MPAGDGVETMVLISELKFHSFSIQNIVALAKKAGMKSQTV